MPVLAVKPKLASGSKTSVEADRLIAVATLAADLHQESRAANDELASAPLHDSETGLYYVWHRYYDPKIGRFITSDPIGLVGGLNTYTYVRNNPLRYTDPTGLFDPGVGTIVESTIATVGAIGSAVIGGIGSLIYSSPAGDPSDMVPPGSSSSSDKNNCPKCDLKFVRATPSYDGKTKSCWYQRKSVMFTFPQWKDKPCYPINTSTCMVDTSTMDPALYGK